MNSAHDDGFLLVLMEQLASFKKQEEKCHATCLILERAIAGWRALDAEEPAPTHQPKKRKSTPAQETEFVASFVQQVERVTEEPQPVPEPRICRKCGSPRSVGSGQLCRRCYRERAEEKRSTMLTSVPNPLLGLSPNPPSAPVLPPVVEQVKKEQPPSLPEPVPVSNPLPPFRAHAHALPFLKTEKPPTKADILAAPVWVAKALLAYPCYVCKEHIATGDSYRAASKTKFLHEICLDGPPALQPPERRFTEAR